MRDGEKPEGERVRNQKGRASRSGSESPGTANAGATNDPGYAATTATATEPEHANSTPPAATAAKPSHDGSY